jgi:hypothetical protein
MTSKTAIMNGALDLLEEDPLLSPDDDRAAARWLNRNYAMVRDGLLRSHPWNFALWRASLAALASSDASAPAWGWTYGYQQPTDCLRVIPLTRSGYANSPPIPHTIEGRMIFTDTSGPLKIRYIRRIEDETQFDALFTQAFQATLAFRAASLITGKQSYAQALREAAREAVEAAKDADVQEGSANTVIDDDWVNGRVTGVLLDEDDGA